MDSGRIYIYRYVETLDSKIFIKIRRITQTTQLMIYSIDPYTVEVIELSVSSLMIF
jgi:hypothetical protein